MRCGEKLSGISSNMERHAKTCEAKIPHMTEELKNKYQLYANELKLTAATVIMKEENEKYRQLFHEIWGAGFLAFLTSTGNTDYDFDYFNTINKFTFHLVPHLITDTAEIGLAAISQNNLSVKAEELQKQIGDLHNSNTITVCFFCLL